jgi:hypothetical protein
MSCGGNEAPLVPSLTALEGPQDEPGGQYAVVASGLEWPPGTSTVAVGVEFLREPREWLLDACGHVPNSLVSLIWERSVQGVSPDTA